MLAILQAMGLLRSCGHPPLMRGCDPPFSPSELMEMERDEQGFIERNPHLFPNMFPAGRRTDLLKLKQARTKKLKKLKKKRLSRREKRMLEKLEIRCAAKE